MGILTKDTDQFHFVPQVLTHKFTQLLFRFLHKVKVFMLKKNDTSITTGGKVIGSQVASGNISSIGESDNTTSIHVGEDIVASDVKSGLISDGIAAETAVMQQFLEELAQNNATANDALNAIKKKLNDNPTLKDRFLSALKAGLSEAVKTAFSHPVIHIPFETIKGFIEAK
jgi:hypothetical protein